MPNKTLIIGNSDGIGLNLTEALLKRGWDIIGISRSESSIQDPAYYHIVAEVQENDYLEKLKAVVRRGAPVELCVYCAGIGELFDVAEMEKDLMVFEVDLIGVVKTASVLIPMMVKRGRGHFMAISSVADEMLSPEAPSYHAAKAGLSNYLEGLALALQSTGVHVTNVRFGFVETKMAKGDVKPFMMTVPEATRHLLTCIEKKPIRYTAPKIIIPLVKFRRLILGLKVK